MADEVVVMTDGRKLLLRSDGTFEFLSRPEPAVIGRALAPAHEWAQDQTLIAYLLSHLTGTRVDGPQFCRRAR